MYCCNNQLINILKEVHLYLNYHNSKKKAPMKQFKYISNKEMYHKIKSQVLSHPTKAIKIILIKIFLSICHAHDQLRKEGYRTHLEPDRTLYIHQDFHFYLSGLNEHRDEKLLLSLVIYIFSLAL